MDIFSSIKKELNHNLPGIEFQKKLLPEGRDIQVTEKVKKDAAVAIIIFFNDISTEILFIKRTTYDGPHSGQVSFPGGKQEDTDKDLYETVTRECFEEIGITLKPSNCLGKLSPVFIPVSGFMVYPFVFIHPISDKINFNPYCQEVEYLIFFNVYELMNNDLIKSTKIKIDDSYTLKTPYYAIKKEIVWGATAMILSEFIEILRRVKAN